MAEEVRKIPISVRNKIAKLSNYNEEPLICGNNDYVIEFDFDDEWDEYPAKTALFVFGNESVPVVFVGNVCQGVAVNGATECAIGVFAGDIRTTSCALIHCVLSITDMGKSPKSPTPDVYNQIMELLQQAISPSSSKLYLHNVKMTSNYPDEEWGDNPSFSFRFSIYRTNDTPITSITDLSRAECVNFEATEFSLWDAPEARRMAIAVYPRNWGDPVLTIDYLDNITEYSGVTISAQYIPLDKITITDDVTEV